jgi:Flp pilus assembly protein protease CpaA
MEALILIFLTICAIYDVRRREVPGWLILPAMVASLAWRIGQPDDRLAWGLALGTITLTLLGLLPGGDMQGLITLALLSPRWYFAAWLGAGITWLIWWVVRHERRIPGYIGFLVGVGASMI